MSESKWDRLSAAHNAWLSGDDAERGRIRARLLVEQPELVDEFDELIAAAGSSQGFLETPAFILVAQDVAREAAELPAGTNVGPYRIAALLARGGMGDVYRATDVRLHRDVALKVMAHGLAADAHQVDRFLQEARVTAALDHPNIVKLYDVGIVDGRPYLVAELLEGETLRARMARGSITVDEVQRIAMAVTSGLVAAHAAGLVHRDMKPENVFLTRAGATKILDFGVAKLVRPDTPVSGTATLPGVLLGTAGYLAPEQTSGDAVDLRADLFSLGAILFEMITGERAFARDHTIDTLYAIRHDPTPDVRDRRADVPSALADIVARLLQKAPDARFQTSLDLLWTLQHVAGEALGESPHAGRRVDSSGAATSPSPVNGRRSTAKAVAAATTVILGVFAVAFWRPTRTAPPHFERLTFRLGVVENARFVPGSEDIAYSAAWADGRLHVYTTRSGALDSRPLLETTAVLRDIGGDGRLLLGVGEDALTTLAVAPPTGRGQRELDTHIDDASWGRDGSMAVLRVTDGRGVIEYPAGHAVYETPGVVRSMRVSPDGESIAFAEHPGPGSSAGVVVVVRRDGTRKALTKELGDLNGLAWSPRGHELFFSGAQAGAGTVVHAVRMDGRSRVVLSAPGEIALHDVSADGHLLISRDTLRASVWLLREDKPPEDLSWFDWGVLSDLSADGRFLLINEIGMGGGVDGGLFLRPTNGNAAVRLGVGQGVDISPDGGFVAVVDEGKLKLVPTGPGGVVELPNPNGFAYRDSQWFPDGQQLSEAVVAPPLKRGMYVRSLRDQTERFITSDISTRPVISPLGDGAAFKDGKGVLVLHAFSSGGRQIVRAVEPRDQIIGWSADGRYLFARTGSPQTSATRDGRSAHVCSGGFPVAILRIDVRDARREVIRTIDSGGSASSCLGVIRISADGKTVAYQTAEITSDLYLVRGVH